MCRHLARYHLFTLVTKPEPELISRRVLQIEYALDFLELLATRNSREKQREVVKEPMKKAKEISQHSGFRKEFRNGGTMKSGVISQITIFHIDFFT